MYLVGTYNKWLFVEMIFSLKVGASEKREVSMEEFQPDLYIF